MNAPKETRLSDLDPGTVGTLCAETIWRKTVHTMTMCFDSQIPRPDKSVAELAVAITEAVRFAQTGATCRWILPVDIVREHIDGELPTLLARCCVARARIDKGDSVTVADVARLSSMSIQGLAYHIRKGALKTTTAGRITADDARAWLVSRDLHDGGAA